MSQRVRTRFPLVACVAFGHAGDDAGIPKLGGESAAHPTHADYVAKVTRAAASAREEGFVLPEDEAAIVAEAAAAAVP